MNIILGYHHILSNNSPVVASNESSELLLTQTGIEIPDFSLEKLINDEILLLFIADWLPFKRQLLDSLTLHIESDLVLIDPEKSPLLVGRFNILTLPTLLYLVNGHEESRLVGAFGPTELGRLKTPLSR
jgi:hypothetical protein